MFLNGRKIMSIYAEYRNGSISKAEFDAGCRIRGIGDYDYPDSENISVCENCKNYVNHQTKKCYGMCDAYVYSDLEEFWNAPEYNEDTDYGIDEASGRMIVQNDRDADGCPYFKLEKYYTDVQMYGSMWD